MSKSFFNTIVITSSVLLLWLRKMGLTFEPTSNLKLILTSFSVDNHALREACFA